MAGLRTKEQKLKDFEVAGQGTGSFLKRSLLGKGSATQIPGMNNVAFNPEFEAYVKDPELFMAASEDGQIPMPFDSGGQRTFFGLLPKRSDADLANALFKADDAKSTLAAQRALEANKTLLSEQGRVTKDVDLNRINASASAEERYQKALSPILRGRAFDENDARINFNQRQIPIDRASFFAKQGGSLEANGPKQEAAINSAADMSRAIDDLKALQANNQREIEGAVRSNRLTAAIDSSRRDATTAAQDAKARDLFGQEASNTSLKAGTIKDIVSAGMKLPGGDAYYVPKVFEGQGIESGIFSGPGMSPVVGADGKPVMGLGGSPATMPTPAKVPVGRIDPAKLKAAVSAPTTNVAPSIAAPSRLFASPSSQPSFEDIHASPPSFPLARSNPLVTLSNPLAPVESKPMLPSLPGLTPGEDFFNKYVAPRRVTPGDLTSDILSSDERNPLMPLKNIGLLNHQSETNTTDGKLSMEKILKALGGHKMSLKKSKLQTK